MNKKHLAKFFPYALALLLCSCQKNSKLVEQPPLPVTTAAGETPSTPDTNPAADPEQSPEKNPAAPNQSDESNQSDQQRQPGQQNQSDQQKQSNQPTAYEPVYEYEQTSFSPRVEEQGTFYLTSLQKVSVYHGEHANYYFDKSFSPELRDRYVETSEQIMKFLVKNADFSGTLDVYAAEGMYFFNQENGKCALGPEYAGTSVQAALLIQAATGSPTANFGLLQAEGFSMTKLFGWDISYVPPIPMTNNNDIEHPLTGKRYELPELGSGAQGNSLTENVLQILEENAEESCFLLDFEYLCFSPNYVEENQVEYAWHLARSLSAYISENGKEREVLRLLMDCDDLFSFEERFTALKNEWLESIGSTVQLSAKEHPIQYGNYGRFALFQMKTAHGDWYVQAGLDSSLTEDKQYAWLLRRNYKETNALMQCYERELAFVDKVLKDPTYNYPRATFTFQEKLSGNLVGEFTGDGNIFLSSAYAIVHEYCHYLLLQEDLFVKKGKSLQKYIGQLHLLPYYYGAYSKTFYLLWSYINDFYERQYTGSKEPIPCPEILEEWLYREMTAEEKEDIVNRANMRAIELMSDRQTENDYSLISFAIYIAQTYGEDTLYLVSTGGNQVEELTGHTWESLRKEWKEYLKKNYDVDSV